MSQTGRAIIWDTETTGKSHQDGDRILEIAAIELDGLSPTGRSWHSFICPERDVPAEVVAIHGLTEEFLSDKPVFAQVVDSFLEFVGGAPMIAHNAPFDVGMINAELARMRRPSLSNPIIDTMTTAKILYPTSPNSLDALCRRFRIDLSKRTSHNALLDCQLLSRVYVELSGGRHHALDFGGDETASMPVGPSRIRPPRTLGAASDEEILLHREFMGHRSFVKPVWSQLPVEEESAAPRM